MRYIILNFLLFFCFLNSFGQEIKKVTLEYKHPYNNEYAYLKIELTKSTNDCHISSVKLEKKELVDFVKNSNKMLSKKSIDCNSYNSITELIVNFDKSSPNKLLGFSDLQDPRQFKLEFVTDSGIEKYESNIGQSFKTNDIALKKFNTIIKEILTKANYKWRKIL